MANKNYYDILGLSKSASDADIKKAYRKLAMQYHPDRNKGDKKAEEKFKEINEAYQVLSDKEKKKNYDQFGSADFSGFSGGNPFGGQYTGAGSTQGFDFGDIFSQFGGAGGTPPGQRGSGGFSAGGFEFDLGDLFGGGRKSSKSRNQYYEEPTPKQKTEEPSLDVTETVDIPFFDFLFDTSISVKTVYGKNLSLKVKAGTKPGTKFKIKENGRTSNGKTGDMYIIVNAKMPKTPLDPKVEKMIEAIRYEV